MYFEARIRKDGKGYRIRFPMLENVLTYAETFEGALAAAEEALVGCLSEDLDRGLDLPMPVGTRKERAVFLIPVPLRISAAILLRKLRRQRNSTTREIAKKLGISRQAYEKLERGLGNPSVQTLERTFAVFGRRLELLIRPTRASPSRKHAA